jgi:hypothetical protein
VGIIVGFKERVNDPIELVLDSTETRRDEFFRVQLRRRLSKRQSIIIGITYLLGEVVRPRRAIHPSAARTDSKAI